MAFFSGRYLLACLFAVPASVVAGGAAWRLTEGLRAGGSWARFGARAATAFAVYATFGALSLLVGGSTVFNGPIRGGGYDSTPLTWAGVFSAALFGGALTALVAPFVKSRKETRTGD